MIYYRWEYVDRNFGNAQGLWTCNPDGTNHAIYYGNNTPSPGARSMPAAVPGTEQVICTPGSCHDRPWGALAILDRRLGLDGRGADAPHLAAPSAMQPGRPRRLRHLPAACRPKYEDPYPLSDKYFLCSRMTGRGEQMGIYLVDVFGNEMLVHVEGPGCFDPMPAGPAGAAAGDPLAHRSRPSAEGYFYVADVYQGTGMERIAARHDQAAPRVVESPEKRFWTEPGWDGGTGQQAPGMDWNDFNNKRILGTVPVEPDGSAYFAVPADTFVYFQLLDEHGHDGPVDAQRHDRAARRAGRLRRLPREPPASAPPARATPLALRRPPSRLEPWHGPPRNFSYSAEVQPVFDRHCVSLPRLRQAGGREAQPGRRPERLLQHFVLRTPREEATSASSAAGRPTCNGP